MTHETLGHDGGWTLAQATQEHPQSTLELLWQCSSSEVFWKRGLWVEALSLPNFSIPGRL